MEALVWLAFASAIGLGAVALAWHTWDLVRHGARANGTVVGWEEDEDTFHALVEFRLPDGSLRSFRSQCGWGWRIWSEGTSVRVVYDAADPSRAEIDRLLDHWLAPTGLLTMALVFLLAALDAVA